MAADVKRAMFFYFLPLCLALILVTSFFIYIRAYAGQSLLFILCIGILLK